MQYNSNNTKEYILCAAIEFESKIIAGYRHGDCYNIFALFNLSHEINKTKQGFLTSWNRFVDRREAYQIAVLSGQVIKDDGQVILTSECLY